MDPRKFDELVQKLSQTVSRRSIVGGTVGASVLTAVGLGSGDAGDDALAKGNKGKKKHRAHGQGNGGHKHKAHGQGNGGKQAPGRRQGRRRQRVAVALTPRPASQPARSAPARSREAARRSTSVATGAARATSRSTATARTSARVSPKGWPARRRPNAAPASAAAVSASPSPSRVTRRRIGGSGLWPEPLVCERRPPRGVWRNRVHSSSPVRILATTTAIQQPLGLLTSLSGHVGSLRTSRPFPRSRPCP